MTRRRAIIVVCDSLAASFVDARRTPALHAMRATAAEFTCARSVFPSTTRTSSASMATGCYPMEHGLLGNTMVIDEGQGLVCLSAGAPDFLERLRAATGQRLQRPTLAQRVAGHGGAVVMSNVSPGAAYLHDPDGFGHVYHRKGSYGPGRVPLPESESPPIAVGTAGDAWLTERFCHDAVRPGGPALALLWLSEPDHTAHHHPLGSPTHLAAIAHADRCVQQVREAVRAIDPHQEEILMLACSDHGMETVHRRIDVEGGLIEAGLKASRGSTDVVVAPNGTSVLFYFEQADTPLVDQVWDWLREQDFCERVVKGGELASLGLPTRGHLRLALSMRQYDLPNAFGVPGRSDSASSPFSSSSAPGNAQHGGLGPNEQHPFLFIEGPGFSPGPRRQAVSLVDIAPTVLRHLKLPAEGMQGRALH